MVLPELKKYAFFGFIFSIAKALVYFTPLILADVLSSSDFGVLEYALAGLGMLINTLFNLGVPGAYPYFIIKEGNKDVMPGFILHPVILIIPFIANQIGFFVFDLDVVFYLAFNISYILSNQVFYSTQLKSHEKSSTAVILDSALYIVLFVFLIGYWFGLFDADILVINRMILFYAWSYVIFALIRFLKTKDNFFSAYKKILKFSVHILFSSFLIFLITTSGRIIVEFFFGFEEVGVYAFYFRLAAIVVMIHQVINIVFFKKIYTLNPKILDRYFYRFFVAISVLSIIIYLLSPYVLNQFSEFFLNTYLDNKGIYFLLSAQMVMWIASALNSNIIDRENLAQKNNTLFALLIIVAGIALFTLSGNLSFSNLVYLHFTCIFLACLIQYYTLYRKKILFAKSAVSLSLLFALESIIYFALF